MSNDERVHIYPPGWSESAYTHEGIEQFVEARIEHTMKGEPLMSMEEASSGRGFKIVHEDDLGQKHTVEAHYNETDTSRLDLTIDCCHVYLDMGETGYFLAWMATWYEEGD